MGPQPYIPPAAMQAARMAWAKCHAVLPRVFAEHKLPDSSAMGVMPMCTGAMASKYRLVGKRYPFLRPVATARSFKIRCAVADCDMAATRGSDVCDTHTHTQF